MTPTPHHASSRRRLTVWFGDTTGPTHAVVHVAGELDLASAHVLASELDLLAGRALDHVDLHLGLVGFCDCAGLDALLRSRRAVAARRGSVRLHDPCASLQVLLDILGLTTALEPRSGAELSSTSSWTLRPRRAQE